MKSSAYMYCVTKLFLLGGRFRSDMDMDVDIQRMDS